MNVLLKITQAPIADGPSEEPQVPSSWRPCDIERLQNLCILFEHQSRSGVIDAVEFLLSIGLHHSPIGWPSLQTLQEIRSMLESEVPQGCSWPDFFITEEQLL